MAKEPVRYKQINFNNSDSHNHFWLNSDHFVFYQNDAFREKKFTSDYCQCKCLKVSSALCRNAHKMMTLLFLNTLLNKLARI